MAGLKSGGRRSPGLGHPKPSAQDVFLNFPYDNQFRKLYLGYIAGLCSFGLSPRATLEIPGGETRLDRIVGLIRSCRYSFHDLSRVELDLHRPKTPRFNMSFELGLAVMASLERPRQHTWCVFESRPHRIQKSLSDLSGTDVYVHGGTVTGLFRELCNALIRSSRRPRVDQMVEVYETLDRSCPAIMRKAGTTSPFGARVFTELVVVANEAAQLLNR
jgi:hypothetical protein